MGDPKVMNNDTGTRGQARQKQLIGWASSIIPKYWPFECGGVGYWRLWMLGWLVEAVTSWHKWADHKEQMSLTKLTSSPRWEVQIQID